MPEVILLQDVEQLGEQGNVVDVSKGYLRNYLLPRKLAQPATRAAIDAIRRRQEAAERAAREAVEQAQDNAALLNRTVLTIAQQAGDDGRLFGSVTTQDIAEAIREARGLKLDRRSVQLRRADPATSAPTWSSSRSPTACWRPSRRWSSRSASWPRSSVDSLHRPRAVGGPSAQAAGPCPAAIRPPRVGTCVWVGSRTRT